MSRVSKQEISCPFCMSLQVVNVYHSVTAHISKLKVNMLLEEELNKHICNLCRKTISIETPILYNDVKRGFALYYSKDINFINEKNPTQPDSYLDNAQTLRNLKDLKKYIYILEYKFFDKNFEINNAIKEIDFSFDSFLSCFLNQSDKLNQINCQNCNSKLLFCGLYDECKDCGYQNIQLSKDKIYNAFSVLKIFNYYFNSNFKQIIEIKLNKILTDIRLNGKINSLNFNDFLSVFLEEEKKYIGNEINNYFIKLLDNELKFTHLISKNTIPSSFNETKKAEISIIQLAIIIINKELKRIEYKNEHRHSEINDFYEKKNPYKEEPSILSTLKSWFK